MTYIFICVLSFSDDSETYITGDGKADAGVILELQCGEAIVLARSQRQNK
ncbi:MAG: hypothetical protein IPL16_01115 [Ignavibacteria bacterium]|nr:hypothetical protein [Ignavibacteria bacterium]